MKKNVHRTPLTLCVVAGLLAVAGGSPARSQAAAKAVAAEPQPPALRLPEGARPVSYAARLSLDPRQPEFDGSIDIRLALDQATDLLWLNATELEIEEAALTWEGREIEAEAVPGGEDFVGFRFPEPVGPGEGTLSVSYRGKISDRDTSGLFRQQEGDDWYIYSQLEAIYARRVFPCFDEPSHKVPWQLTLTVPANMVATTNTPGEKATTKLVPPAAAGRGAAAGRVMTMEGAWTEIRFAATPPMPSYLVAVGVGPFDVVDLGSAGSEKTPMRILTPRGKGDKTVYVQQIMPDVLEALESYFGIPYPYAKLDSLAIPQTFSFGAMENAGLVTYNERLLVASPEEETLDFKRRAAGVIAHELAHQWFGNLVTNAWWDEIWLNESFATWMANKIVMQLWPEWDADVDRVERRHFALGGDQLLSARQIRQPIVEKADIFNAFDGVSYGKGASILSMFEAWIGEEKFRQGVRQYLQAHRWGIATADDFLGALAAASEPRLAAAFNTFLEQVGAPMIRVSLECGEGQPAALNLTQERLLPEGTPPTDQTWQLPVCAAYPGAEGEARSCTLLTDESGRLPLDGADSCPAWVLANDGERGYYVALYDEDLLGALLTEGRESLSTPALVGLLGDADGLAGAGKLPRRTALALASEFAGAESWQLVRAAAGLASLDESLVPEGLDDAYARYLQASFGDLARQLGWEAGEGESDDRKQLREAVVPMMALRGEDPELIAAAGRLARAWLADRSAVDPELIAETLAVAARNGDAELFDAMAKAVAGEEDRRNRERLFAALGSFTDPELERRALGLILSGDHDAREAMGILRAAVEDDETRPLAWDFFKANLDALLEHLPREMGVFLPFVGSGFCDAEGRRDVEAYFTPRTGELVGSERTLRQTLEIIGICVERKRRQGDAVAAFLAGYPPPPQESGVRDQGPGR
ncbi:MAG: M1 family aminopeptidase [Thermoanaerobaculia bacterium]